MEFYRYTYVEIVKLISLYSLFNSGSLICVRSTLTCNALGSLDVIKKSDSCDHQYFNNKN